MIMYSFKICNLIIRVIIDRRTVIVDFEYKF